MKTVFAAAAAAFFAMPVMAQDPPPDGAVDVLKGQPYSPNANRGFPTQVLFGDTHVHSALSADAGGGGTTLMPRDMYRFARGEQVTSNTGQPVKLPRPFDFYMLTEHTDGMGVITDIMRGAPFDREYLETRARWEKLLEIGQTKGDSETHPLLSPTDEFADYEQWDWANLDVSEAKTPEMLPFEYARSILKYGLQFQANEGVNPFKLDPEVVMITQERAYTSPIWYTPN
ncbi:hypothetical protein C1J05_20225 [Sulfitobacter sp. JL08]|uniref:DUF3604 domain-containing protein n=1 Tax=Sulfitobacter sp. JL08 TaxID=2070369 RepID=UPI000E0B15E8|nr:DUF3604 domain-containing protein [Sulfitobacter sp. JL08]AXI56521.1 hypothetical protein C1J05_20225 [Sulfitobacter sp. JL08]